MRCQQCAYPLTASAPCPVCRHASALPRPDGVDVHLLLDAATTALADPRLCDPTVAAHYVDLLALLAARGAETQALLPLPDDATLACIPRPQSLTVAYYAARANRPEAAAAWLLATFEPGCEPLEEDGHGQICFRVDEADGGLQLSARATGNGPQEWLTVLTASRADGAAACGHGLPSVFPFDWTEWQVAELSRAAAVFFMWLAVSAPEAGGAPPRLEPWVREQWAAWQQSLNDARDRLGPLAVEEGLQAAVAARDRSFFRSMDVEAWLNGLGQATGTDIEQAADGLSDEGLRAAEGDLDAVLQACLALSGLQGLEKAGEEMDRGLATARTEVTRLQQQQARTAARAREALRLTLESLKRRAASLTWPLSRPPELDDVNEQARILVERERDTAILQHVLRWNDELARRGATVHATRLERARLLTRRLGNLRRGVERRVKELAAWDPAAGERFMAGVEALRAEWLPTQRKVAWAWTQSLPNDNSDEAVLAVLDQAAAVLADAWPREGTAPHREERVEVGV